MRYTWPVELPPGLGERACPPWARGTGPPCRAGRAPACRARRPAGWWPGAARSADTPVLHGRTVQQVEQVLGGDVAGGGGGERAAADAAGAGVERGRRRQLDGGDARWRSRCCGCCGSASAAGCRARRRRRRRPAPGPAAGTPTPIVSASASSSGLRLRRTGPARRRPARRPPRPRTGSRTRPRWSRSCAARPRGPGPRSGSTPRSPSSVSTPWLRRLNVSVATTTTLTSSTPAAIARSSPRSLSTSPIQETAPRGSRPQSASASASCGTRAGFTKLVTSIRRTPLAGQRADQLELVVGGQDRGLVLQAVARAPPRRSAQIACTYRATVRDLVIAAICAHSCRPCAIGWRAGLHAIDGAVRRRPVRQAAEQAARRLRDDILSGRIPAGARLGEVELAEPAVGEPHARSGRRCPGWPPRAWSSCSPNRGARVATWTRRGAARDLRAAAAARAVRGAPGGAAADRRAELDRARRAGPVDAARSAGRAATRTWPRSSS